MESEKRTGVFKRGIVLFQILAMLCVFLFASGVVFAAPVDDFVITVKTDNTGASSDTQFEIPTYPGETYNYNVDCDNDGTDEATGVTDNYTCNYPTAGTYTIRIKDNTGTGNGFPRIYFHDTGDRQKLLSVNQWGTGHWTSMEYAFWGCSNLNSAHAVNNGVVDTLPDWAADAPDLSNVTSTYCMFSSADSFNQDISSWNVSHVRDMGFMFSLADSFNQDIGGWNVSNVVDMYGMFSSAASFNQDIGGWNVSNVVDMSHMFAYAASFNQDIGGWDVSHVRDMSGMFAHAYSFNQDISSWDVSHVRDMGTRYYPYSNEVGMFTYAVSFNQDISGWDVSNVISMEDVFKDARSFDQDLGNWDVSNVTDMTDMFTNSGMSTDNYDDTLIGWSTRSLQSNVRLDSSAHYCRSENQRQSIINTYGWTINDAGKSCGGQAVSDNTTPVPTMSEWGMILTGLFMLFASFVMIRRKKENE